MSIHKTEEYVNTNQHRQDSFPRVFIAPKTLSNIVAVIQRTTQKISYSVQIKDYSTNTPETERRHILQQLNHVDFNQPI